jgi:hypothetical protein
MVLLSPIPRLAGHDYASWSTAESKMIDQVREVSLRLSQATKPNQGASRVSACRSGRPQGVLLYYTTQSFERTTEGFYYSHSLNLTIQAAKESAISSTILCFALLVFGRGPAFLTRAILNLAALPHPVTSPVLK